MLTGAHSLSPQPASNSSDVFRGISDAFDAALHHAVIPSTLAVVVAAVVIGATTFALVRRIRRENARMRAESLAREDQRRRIAKTTPPERREYVRVPARISLTIPRHAHVETEDLSGGGLSFSSQAPPRLGAKLDLVLDLGDQHALAMHGEVVRVSPSRAPAGPAVVGVAFRDVATATREALVQWIAAEELRGIAEKRRGPLCSICGLPLGEADARTHPSCASAAATGNPPPRASGAPPRASLVPR